MCRTKFKINNNYDNQMTPLTMHILTLSLSFCYNSLLTAIRRIELGRRLTQESNVIDFDQPEV